MESGSTDGVQVGCVHPSYAPLASGGSVHDRTLGFVTRRDTLSMISWMRMRDTHRARYIVAAVGLAAATSLASGTVPASLAQTPTTVVHIKGEDFNRQKPVGLQRAAPKVVPGDVGVPQLPERTRTEAWLLRSGDRVVQSVGITSAVDGTELQRTVQDAQGTWLYYPGARLAIHFASTRGVSTPPTALPVGRTTRREPIPASLVESQSKAERVSGYLADLDPREVVFETDSDPTGQLVRDARFAVDAQGQQILVQERRISLREDLPPSAFGSAFWTFTPPAGTTILRPTA